MKEFLIIYFILSCVISAYLFKKVYFSIESILGFKSTTIKLLVFISLLIMSPVIVLLSLILKQR